MRISDWSPDVCSSDLTGLPRERRASALSASQPGFLGRLSRRTWAFFEDFVTEADHWLPPDNIQEHPSLLVARRTSPTNVGLALLANLSAHDFRSEEHTSELQSLLRISYAVFCLKKTTPRLA